MNHGMEFGKRYANAGRLTHRELEQKLREKVGQMGQTERPKIRDWDTVRIVEKPWSPSQECQVDITTDVYCFSRDPMGGVQEWWRDIRLDDPEKRPYDVLRHLEGPGDSITVPGKKSAWEVIWIG